MSDEQFYSFVATCRDELALLQPQFQQRVCGSGKWFYDRSDCTLRVGEEGFSITPVGTHSSEYQSWLWAWANEDFPTPAREASKVLQTLEILTGFRVFTNPGIRASESDALDLSALAVHSLGALGIFRVPGATTLFLAVLEPADRNARNS